MNEFCVAVLAIQLNFQTLARCSLDLSAYRQKLQDHTVEVILHSRSYCAMPIKLHPSRAKTSVDWPSCEVFLTDLVAEGIVGVVVFKTWMNLPSMRFQQSWGTESWTLLQR